MTTHAWVGGAAEGAWVGGAAWAAEVACPSPFDLLAGLLDEYDRITGRGDVAVLDYQGVCRVMAGHAS